MSTDLSDLANLALYESMINFQPQPNLRLHMKRNAGGPPELGSGIPVPNGVTLLENGNLCMTMYAPKATQVEVKVGRKDIFSLQKQKDGIFSLELPPLSNLGPVTIEFMVQGVSVIHPYVPIYYSNQRLYNYYEMPDPKMEQLITLDAIPHGTVHKDVYYSSTMKSWLRCFVYTPPGYDATKQYPVLYLQHGAGENETAWLIQGKVNYLMDALLANKACVPFLIVMNDGMLKLPEEAHLIDSFEGLSSVITLECRSFIEANYAVKQDAQNRAIAGLSLGSMFTSYVSCTHPELYGSIGIFSGFLRRRDHFPNYEENPHLQYLNEERVKHNFQLYFRSMGDQDMHFHEFLEDDLFLHELHVDTLPYYHRVVYPGYSHDWSCWRRTFCDFAQVLFQPSQD